MNRKTCYALIIVGVLILAVAIYFAYLPPQQNIVTQTTQNDTSKEEPLVGSTPPSKDVGSASSSDTQTIITPNEEPVPAGWSVFQNKQYGFSFQYPNDWGAIGNENVGRGDVYTPYVLLNTPVFWSEFIVGRTLYIDGDLDGPYTIPIVLRIYDNTGAKKIDLLPSEHIGKTIQSTSQADYAGLISNLQNAKLGDVFSHKEQEEDFEIRTVYFVNPDDEHELFLASYIQQNDSPYIFEISSKFLFFGRTGYVFTPSDDLLISQWEKVISSFNIQP